jgi:basic membrane protein A and related proteins
MASRIASSSRRTPVTTALVLAVLLLIAAPASSRAVQPRFLACLVTGTGGPDDPAFNRLAVVGLHDAEGNGVVTRAARGSSQADYTRELRSCARDGAGITIGVGYVMATAVDQVATAFPREAFAILDVDVKTLAHRPANVEGLLFRGQEGGYLAGYAAGLWAARRGGAAVGAVGGLDIPPVERALAGFRFGAKRAHPGLRVLIGYSGGFGVPASCAHEALDQIAKGSVVEFQAAGPCGVGVLDAAESKGVVGIGLGADQAVLGPYVLTTAVERADVAVETAVRTARTGKPGGGTNLFFDTRNGGITVGRWSRRVGASVRRAVAGQFALLKAGRITGIPTTVQ